MYDGPRTGLAIQWQDFGTFECSPILSSHFSRASAPMTFTLTTYTH